MSDPQQTTLPVDSDSTTPLPTGDNETSSNLLASAAISASASSLNSVASSRASALTNKSGIRPPSKIGLLHGARPKTLQPAQEPAASSNSSAILTEDTDSFIIGQRVWVGGNKPGHIAFIGDTTFAPGEWAGIALDEPIGKNDGSVGGTRYFMCEPKKGVFCRLTRLTRVPLDHGGSSDMTPFSTPTSQIGSHRMLGMSPSPTESHRSMMKSPVSPFDSNTSLSSGQVDYTLGDRVIIKSGQGSKVGTVRYMGLTEFAKGEWIGVELDEPRGKNDGSVNGIRYFECQPRFGIFSPISKVSKSPSNVKPIHCQVHSPTGGVPSSGLRRASSKESITSNLSMMSSASTAPRRKSPTTPNTTTRTVAARTAWQAVLEEKQKHIEQLLKEKDLDRAEATRAASQASEAERKLLVSTQEFAKYREECGAQLQKHLRLLNELKENRLELETQLEDEKKKNEDWQFKYEEAEIFRAHIQAQSETRNKEYDNLMLEHEKLKTKAQEQLEELRKANDAQANSDNVTINFQTEMQTAQLELEAVKKDLSQCQTNLSDIKCKLEGERDELHNSLQLKISEVDNLRKELSDTVTARDKSLAERAGELEEKLESIDNLNNVLIQQKEESKKILNELIEHHKKALDERDSNISQINSAIANKEKDISQLNIKISELESTIVNKNDEFEKLKSEMELVLEKSKTDADIIANLIKENENNNNLLNIETNLRQELGSVKVQLENVTEKLNIKTAETENIIQENKKALDEKDAIISQINTVIANKAEDISRLNIQISELESTIVSKNTEFEKLKSEMEHVLEKSKTEADIIANLIKENENNNNLLNIETNLRQQLDSIKVQLENVTEKLNIKTAETENIIQENKKALDAKDSIISQINTVIANKSEDISQLSIKIAELESTIASKNAEFEKLKSEMERVREKGKADAEIIGNLNSESKNNNLLNVETNLREELDNVKLQLNIKTAEIENIIQEKNSIALKLEAKINELNKVESELILRTDNLEQKRIIESSLKEQLNEAKLELNSEHAKLVAEKDELRNVAQSLEEKLDQANIALAEKTKQVVEKDDAIVQLNENQKKINDAAQSLEEKLDQANIALAEKTKQVGEKDDAIIQLNENQKKLNDAAQSLEEKLDQANIALAEKTKLVVEKDDTIIQLNENQSKLNAAAQSLEEKLDQANIALAEKTNQVVEKDDAIIQLNENQKKLNDVAQSLEEKLDQANIALAEKIKQVVEKDDTIIQLNENQKKLNDKMENCEKDIKTKSEEIRTLNQQIEHGNTLLRANTEQVNNLTELMSNEENFLRTALDALETENQRSELNSKVLEQKLVNVESEKKLLDLKVQEASAQVTELEQKVLEKDGLIKSLKLEAEKVKANNELVMEEHAESIIKDAENEFKKKIDEVSLKWEAKVMDLQAEIFMLKDQLSMAVQPTSSSIAIAGPSGSVIKPEDTPEYRKLLEGKAYSDAQLEFVNSIIVDMLKKNEEHLMRIDLLEQGYSPAFVERAKESGYKVPERQVAPRKYCDICQEFDQHETEDCPKQESDEPLSSVQLGKEKKEKPPPRPYCTICEEFGHDTADCTVSQEF